MGNGVVWIKPKFCIPPHRISHPTKLQDLAQEFARVGWNPEEPALVGYPYGGNIQLLSGTHRHGAALLSKLSHIPIIIHQLDDVEEAWGHLDKWNLLMTAPKAGKRHMNKADVLQSKFREWTGPDELFQVAKLLKYPYFEWQDRVYTVLLSDNSYCDSGFNYSRLS